jgi:hypothetical protein
MLKNISHAGGVEKADEILFNTPFGYMFPQLAALPECKLPERPQTLSALQKLGTAMADPGTPDDPQAARRDSSIPAIFTYLGQFIDHDITARTDRDTGLSRIADEDGNALNITPLEPDVVLGNLKNGRRPQLDLDNMYGDGPSLLPPGTPGADSKAGALYNHNFTLKVEYRNGYIDLPRDGRSALIADMRNDENLIVSQFHAAMLRFHNKVMATLNPGLSYRARYVKARRLVRWAYQYVVINDYLKHVCDESIVEDVLHNGPRFFGPRVNGGPLAMPLEFSVAGFRFGHSMIRPFYRLNRVTGQKLIAELLGVSTEDRRFGEDLLEAQAGWTYRLKPEFVIEWENFVRFDYNDPQKARKIDAKLALGLFDLGLPDTQPNTVLAVLTQRNLLRGYLLSIPTGQAIASAMGIVPLTGRDLLAGESQAVKEAFYEGDFDTRTPLWYYILKEAEVQKKGESLGAVGSRLVAETLVGLIKEDPNSYLNNVHNWAVSQDYNGNPDGIRVEYGTKITTVADILKFAGVPLGTAHLERPSIVVAEPVVG